MAPTVIGLKEAVETAAADHSEHAPIVVHAPFLMSEQE
jgi:hypothetical protein